MRGFGFKEHSRAIEGGGIMNKFDIIIFERLYERPCWAKTFYQLKSRLTALIAADYVERVSPPGNSAKNMVALTKKGAARIERHWSVKERKLDLVQLADRMAEHDESPQLAAKQVGLSKNRAQIALNTMIIELGAQAS